MAGANSPQRGDGMNGVWECPVCGWAVSDVEYLHIVLDPDCAGCGAKKWSEFRYIATDEVT